MIKDLLQRHLPTFFPAKKGQKHGARTFAGVLGGRLNADWLSGGESIDSKVLGSLETLRNRCRELEHDNDYVRRYFNLLAFNVIGSEGFNFQSKVTVATAGSARTLPVRQVIQLQRQGRMKAMGFELDTDLNNQIEEAWREFSDKRNFTVAGDLPRTQAEQLILMTLARDGEALIRKVLGYPNDFSFSLQLIEPELLDHNLNRAANNGNMIRMGVELNPWRKPIAYWLLTSHPNDFSLPRRTGSTHVRVPAAEIIHLKSVERIGQTRGIPWMVSAISRLKTLQGYEHAELVAARAMASKMGFFEKQSNEGFQGEEDIHGDLIDRLEAGVIEELPMGVSFKGFDPTHPSSSYATFRKGILQGIGSGLGISYPSLGSDLEGVNYSSIRAGLLEDREYYKTIQSLIIRCFCEDVFANWLPMAILSGRVPLPSDRSIAEITRPYFLGKRWEWVDPERDIKASIAALEGGLTSARRVISERGGDIEEIYSEIEADRKLAEQHGLQLTPIKSTA